MPPLSCRAAEAGICLLTAGVLGAALWRAWAPAGGDHGLAQDPGRLAGLLAFVVLAPAAVLAEQALCPALGKLYSQRRAGSSGLALGALALPWALAGLAVKQQQQQRHATGGNNSYGTGGALPPAAHALLASVAASAAALALLLLWGLLSPLDKRGEVPKHPGGSNGRAGGGSFKARSGQQPALRGRLQLALMLSTAALLLAGHAAAVLPATSGGRGSPWRTAVAACGVAHALLALLPGVFTAGEGLIAAEAAALLGGSALRYLQQAPPMGMATPAPVAPAAADPFRRFVVLLLAGSLAAAAALLPLLLWRQQMRRAGGAARRAPIQTRAGLPAGRRQQQQQQPSRTSTAAAAAAAAVALLALAALAPAALWALRLASSSRRRLALLAWWGGDMAAALPAMAWLSGNGRLRAILVRKGYHLLAVSLFLPALLMEPGLLGVALAGAWALLLAAEALRLSGLPAIADRVHAFMTSFIDERDSGPILVTHFTLLLGMAAPIWLSNAMDPRMATASGSPWAAGDGGGAAAAGTAQGQQPLWLAALAGIMILGFGDTAASAVGSLYGRRRLCAGCNKTWEGTAASVAATLAAWGLLAAAAAALGGSGGALGLVPLEWPVAAGGWWGLAAATALSSLLEGVTAQLDNVFVPLHFFALLCLM